MFTQIYENSSKYPKQSSPYSDPVCTQIHTNTHAQLAASLIKETREHDSNE